MCTLAHTHAHVHAHIYINALFIQSHVHTESSELIYILKTVLFKTNILIIQ